MIIREARQSDNEALQKLTALTSMQGDIGLRIERSPDFFALINDRGLSIVLVAEKNREVLGCIAASIQQSLCFGDRIPIYYICDFRVHPDYSKNQLAFLLVRELQDRLNKVGADILICTTVNGNAQVEAFLSGRAGIPKFRNSGLFMSYQILPRLYKSPCFQFIKRVENDAGLEELCKFYNQQGKDYDLIPDAHQADLKGKINLLIRQDNQIVAAISLANQMNLKQNIVTNLPFSQSIISELGRTLYLIFPFYYLPKVGESIRLINVKRMAAIEDQSKQLKSLLNYARYLAYRDQFSFITLALHPKDPYNKLIVHMPKFRLKSNVWITSLKGNQQLIDQISNGLLFEDYSLV